MRTRREILWAAAAALTSGCGGGGGGVSAESGAQVAAAPAPTSTAPPPQPALPVSPATAPPTAAQLLLANMRARAAAAGPLMLSGAPPLITAGTSGSASGIPGSVLVTWDSGKFFFSGSMALAGTVYPNWMFGNNRAVSYAAGVQLSNFLAIEFVTDAPQIEVYLKGTGSNANMRFVVDGLLASDTPITYPNNGGLYLTKLAFGSRQDRRIRILANNPHFGGVRIGVGDTLTLPPVDSGFRAMLLGDSIIEGPAGQAAATSLAPVAAQLLGWSDAWISGVGATGYLAAPAPKLTLRQRFDADVKAFAPDVVVVAAGTNDPPFSDAQVQTEAALLFDRFQNEMPDTLVFVVGLWNPRSAYRSSLNDAIKMAAAGRPNFYWVPAFEDHWLTGTGRVGAPMGDGNSDSFVSPDGTHPSPAGIPYLGDKLADAITLLIQ